MQLTMPKTIGRLSMVLVILIVFVGASALTLSRRTIAHAATITNMPTSFQETVPNGGGTYTWTLKENPTYSKTSLDSGVWDVYNDSTHTDLGLVGTSVTITQSHGVNSYAVTTLSSIPGVAGILSGRRTEAIPEHLSDDYRSVFNQVTVVSTDPAGHKAWEVNTDGEQADSVDLTTEDTTLGPQIFRNISAQISQEQQAYVEEENAYAYKGNTRSSTLAFHQPTHPAVLSLPAGVLVLAGAGLLLTTTGGIVSAICNNTKCSGNPVAWKIAGGIMSALGTAALVVSSSSASGWMTAAQVQQGAMSSATAAAAVIDLSAKVGAAVAVGSASSISAEAALLFPEIAITAA
jgi:hypothetical protein